MDWECELLIKDTTGQLTQVSITTDDLLSLLNLPYVLKFDLKTYDGYNDWLNELSDLGTVYVNSENVDWYAWKKDDDKLYITIDLATRTYGFYYHQNLIDYHTLFYFYAIKNNKQKWLALQHNPLYVIFENYFAVYKQLN